MSYLPGDWSESVHPARMDPPHPQERPAGPPLEGRANARQLAVSHAGRKQFVTEMQRLGVDVSRETGDRLETLVSTLERWQKTINLVGRNTLGDVWHRHVLDSAQLKPLIPDGAKTLTDLGSGAGFPGLVLAALCPGLAVTLIESDARKSAFLGEAARRMGLEKPPKIVVGRIESAAPSAWRRSLPPGRSHRWASCSPGRTGTERIPLFAFSTRVKAGRLR